VPGEQTAKHRQSLAFFGFMTLNLARTTLRNIIATLTLKSANSERGKINDELQKTLRKETITWGIEIVRTELKEKLKPLNWSTKPPINILSAMPRFGKGLRLWRRLWPRTPRSSCLQILN